MTAARSAGILLYRRRSAAFEVLLVHPGGPFWVRRDEGAWSLPKGEYRDGEDPLAAARREFEEELGVVPADTGYVELGEVKQKAGKVVRAWGLEGDLDPDAIISNEFELEWPPRSGQRRRFSEVDRAQWFTVLEARAKINPAQVKLLDQLLATVTDGGPSPG